MLGSTVKSTGNLLGGSNSRIEYNKIIEKSKKNEKTLKKDNYLKNINQKGVSYLDLDQ